MNIVFDDGQHIIGKAPEWFFKPIDNIYGDYKDRCGPKSDLYLKDTNGNVIDLRDFYNTNKSCEWIGFKIFLLTTDDTSRQSDSKSESYFVELINLENKKISEWFSKTEGDSKHELVSTLFIPRAKLALNPNFLNNTKPIYLRLGKYSTNRYVIYFHGDSETNNPGRIPAE